MATLKSFGAVLVMLLTCYLKINAKLHVSGELCVNKIFLEPVPNRVLINHVISQPEVTSEELCRIQCFIESKCESYNFGPKEGGGHVCELSDSDDFRDPRHWITKQGFLYVGTQNPCTRAPLPPTALYCHSNFEKDMCKCKCMKGFTGKRCEVDIDECNDDIHTCHGNATCNNTNGSYNCTCNPGFIGDRENNCTDIDECGDGLHTCHGNATCNNTNGSYNCLAIQGFLETVYATVQFQQSPFLGQKIKQCTFD